MFSPASSSSFWQQKISACWDDPHDPVLVSLTTITLWDSRIIDEALRKNVGRACRICTRHHHSNTAALQSAGIWLIRHAVCELRLIMNHILKEPAQELQAKPPTHFEIL